MEIDIQEFSSLARRWASYFRVAGKIAVAIRATDGWHLRFARTIFSTENLPVSPIDIETQSIRAIRELVKLDANSAATILDEALARPGAISFRDWQAALAPEMETLLYHYDRLYPQRMSGPMRLPVLFTQPNQTQTPSFPSTHVLDLELLAHTIPFETFAELLGELSVSGNHNEITFRPCTEIVLSPPASIDHSSHMKDGKLVVTVNTHPAIIPSELRLTFKIFPKDGSSIRRAAFVKGKLEKIETDREGRIIYSLAMPDVPAVLALLSHRGEFLGKWWVRDETLSFNERLQVHRTVDIQGAFRKNFFDNRDEFEGRIELLLELLGLNSLGYGKIPRLTDAPDILAISTDRHVYVIECTTGDINNKGKLQKLSDRAKAIADEFARSRHPVAAVQPVLFTSLLRSETAAHWAMAANLKIALVCREEITNLLMRLESPPTPQALYTEALAAIPEAATPITSGST